MHSLKKVIKFETELILNGIKNKEMQRKNREIYKKQVLGNKRLLNTNII